MLAYALALVVLPLSAAAEPAPADFYVAPDGSDGNAGTYEAPFISVAQAQRAVRARVAAGLDKDVRVLIRGGVYRLQEPLAFGPEDSGSEAHGITYAAYPGEEVILSGGRPITGWQKADGDKWTVELAEVKAGAWGFRELFADGRRLPRGRYPNAPDPMRVQSVSEDVKQVVLDGVPGLDNLAGRDAELVMFQNWSISRVAIVSSEGATVHLNNPMGWIGHGAATTASPGKPVYVENAVEFVDQPGEWYLDRASGVLTYQGGAGEDPNTRTFVAPVATHLVIVAGRAGTAVRNLHFEGLAFEYNAWSLPPFGYLGIQACHHGTRTDERFHVLPVALEFTYAEDCSLDGCRLAHLGASGAGFGIACRRNRIEGCTVEDIGGNGLMVGWRGKGDVFDGDAYMELSADWTKPEYAPSGNIIAGNTVCRCGAVNHGAVGIFDAFSADTRIEHNHVFDMPYTGISVGFRWDSSATNERGAQILYNHVHDTMQMLADGGCLYTLGLQPGAVIRGNLFHGAHRSSYAHGGAPNNGIFFDEGSKGLHVEGNIIYDTTGDPIRFNQTNRENLTWGENSFGVGPDDPAFPHEAARKAGPSREAGS
ncbi:MAG: right-handed parallel beta-helix repeat-containing protein [Candidatus Hydrogenedentes bacterium]|nr:right-handed parallel beta-helix repeat-containing protein [Candidatus Hydrogenedentota bacterium]